MGTRSNHELCLELNGLLSAAIAVVQEPHHPVEHRLTAISLAAGLTEQIARLNRRLPEPEPNPGNASPAPEA